jgi:hypothetical protein
MEVLITASGIRATVITVDSGVVATSITTDRSTT